MYSSSIESPLVPPSDGRHRSDTGTVGMSDRGIDRDAGLAPNPGPRIPYSEKYQNSSARPGSHTPKGIRTRRPGPRIPYSERYQNQAAANLILRTTKAALLSGVVPQLSGAVWLLRDCTAYALVLARPVPTANGQSPGALVRIHGGPAIWAPAAPVRYRYPDPVLRKVSDRKVSDLRRPAKIDRPADAVSTFSLGRP